MLRIIDELDEDTKNAPAAWNELTVQLFAPCRLCGADHVDLLEPNELGIVFAQLRHNDECETSRGEVQPLWL